MLIVAPVLLLALPRQPFGAHARARVSTRRPQQAAIEPAASQAILCDADRSKDCSWSMMNRACVPRRTCRPVSCGLLTCDCTALGVSALPPWEVLGLNATASLDATAVRRAFAARARALSPQRNEACLARAGKEYVAARRARDILLLLSSVAHDDADHGRLQTSSDNLVPKASKKKSKKKKKRLSKEILSIAPRGPASRTTTSPRGRANTKRHKPRMNVDNAPANLGTQISIFLAIKVALYRVLKDYKTKVTRGWWRRARHFVSDVVHTGGRVVRRLFSFVHDHGALILVALVSLTAVPVMALA